MMDELPKPIAGDTWRPKFTSHAPFTIKGYDPAAGIVFRDCGEAGISAYTLEKLYGGWHVPRSGRVSP